MGRVELLYTCIANLVRELSRDGRYDLIDNLKEYEDPNNRNRVIYHDRRTSNNDKLQKLIDDATALLPKCKEEYEYTDDYQLLLRALGDQSNKEQNSPNVYSIKIETTPSGIIRDNG